MDDKKRTMILALKSALLEQGYYLGTNFEEQASKLSLSQIAIEISLAQAGI
ncbi:hypothetical protein [Streptococcus sp. E17BB]|uniref:hypothetical protein n=1 Tax=Streptococcus sp. E17BB TaxID=3278714 RepID=UPI00359E2000